MVAAVLGIPKPTVTATVASDRAALTTIPGSAAATPTPLANASVTARVINTGSVRNLMGAGRRDLHGFGSWAGEDHA